MMEEGNNIYVLFTWKLVFGRDSVRETKVSAEVCYCLVHFDTLLDLTG